jgi:putative sterol carrier protein
MALFPTPEWTQAFMDKLNTDQKYAEVARDWEGDLCFLVEPGGPVKEQIVIYLDLWHGKCRRALYQNDLGELQPAFLLKAPYPEFKKVLSGTLSPMQALLTRRLHVTGSMTLLMRNVPTILDFVRCAQEVTTATQ